AEPLQRAALDLVLHAVGRRNRPAILRCDEARDANASGLLIDVDLGDQRAITVVAFVETAGDAASARRSGAAGVRSRRGARLPGGPARGGAHDLLETRIAQVPQSVRDRIRPDVRGDFVDERLV